MQYATAGPTGSPTWKLGFVYDRYGNRTNENLLAGIGPSGTWTPDPTTNRLPAPYGYDAAGNMTNDSFNTYAFDAVNRVKQVTSNGATYSYDGNGLRVQRMSSGTTTTYVFSGTKVIAEYTGGTLSKEYIYAGLQLLATVDASTGSTSYQHPDHLSTRVETSSTAGVTRTFGHFPFGEVWYETGTASPSAPPCAFSLAVRVTASCGGPVRTTCNTCRVRAMVQICKVQQPVPRVSARFLPLRCRAQL
ncbi:MAG: hypothetical protein WA188_18135 [Terriglobales bacterium]